MMNVMDENKLLEPKAGGKEMTNEEIRLNHYCKQCRNYDKGCDWLCRKMICNEADAYEMALDEKDRQFKEYLAKKRDGYLSQRDDADMWSEQWAVYHALACTMHQILNELFPTQNKDNSENDE